MDKINKQIIQGVFLTKLKQIHDERGAVYHVLKKDSDNFKDFGEAYFSKVNKNVVKAWKFHKRMTQNFSVPFGKMKIVLFDNRKESGTKGILNTFILDDDINYNLLTIPPQIWYGFQCIDSQYSLLLNIADLQHDPEESVSVDNNDIPYNW